MLDSSVSITLKLQWSRNKILLWQLTFDKVDLLSYSHNSTQNGIHWRPSHAIYLASLDITSNNGWVYYVTPIVKILLHRHVFCVCSRRRLTIAANKYLRVNHVTFYWLPLSHRLRPLPLISLFIKFTEVLPV